MPGRSINYNLLLDMPRRKGDADGRFKLRDDARTNILDNSRTFVSLKENVWIIANANNGKDDRVILTAGDNLCIAVGEKLPAGQPSQIASIRANTLVSRKNEPPRVLPPGSPFGPANDPNAAFEAVFPAAPGFPLLGRADALNVLDNDGNRYDTHWYLLDLGHVRAGAEASYVLTVGASVTTTDGRNLTFAHDPEVDVGTDPGAQQPPPPGYTGATNA